MASFEKKKKRLIFLAFAVYIILAHTPALLSPYVDIDESDFAVQTMVWLHGGTPYIDFVEKKPPVIHAAYALGFLIGGEWNMTAVHIVFSLIVIATGFILMATAQRAAGNATGLTALILFAAYQAGYDLNDFLMAGTEIPMNLFAVSSAYCLVLTLGKVRRLGPLFWSGIFTSLAILSKPVAIAFLPAIFVADLWDRKKRGILVATISDAIAFSVGCVLPIALVATWLAGNGALDDAIRWTWKENLAYAEMVLPLWALLKNGAIRFGVYAIASLPLWFLAAGRAVSAFRSRSWTAPDLMMATWLIASFYMASLGMRFFPHYFLQFLPPLIYLAARGWTAWLEIKLNEHKKFKMGLIIIGVLIPLITFPFVQFCQAKKIPRSIAKERAIANVVSKLTTPDDRIFVWGHSSDIYLLSQRLPASRFVYCSFLSGASEGYESQNQIRKGDEDAWQMLISDLSRRPPALIVDMSGTGIRGYGTYPINAFDKLGALAEREYQIVAVINGARVLTKKTPPL